MNADDHSFESWMRAVDAILTHRIGLSHDDLPDQCWRNWFENDLTPAQAAQECLDNEGIDL
jgi:hypothetical protein